MPDASRRKGVEGKAEAKRDFAEAGATIRDLQNNVKDAGDFIAEFPAVALLVESKRAERINIHEAMKQVMAVSGDGQVPCVSHRRSYEPRFVTLLQADFAKLLGTK